MKRNIEQESYISFSFRQLNKTWKTGSFEVLLSALFSMALVGAVCFLFRIPAVYSAIGAVILIAALLIWVSDHVKIIVLSYTKYILAVLPVICGAFTFSHVKNGTAIILNDILQVCGETVRTIYMPFEVSCSTTEYNICTTWVCMLGAVWLLLAVTYITVSGRDMAAGAITAIVLALHLAVKPEGINIWMPIMVVCAAGIVGKAFITHNSLTAKENIHISKAIAGTLVLSAIVLCMMNVIIPAKDYSKNESVDNIGNSAYSMIKEARYGKADLRSMPVGDFKDLGDLNFSGAEMLRLEAESFDSLYLRGFTGEVYDENGWDILSGKVLYKYSDDFFHLHDKDFFGQNRISYTARTLTPKKIKDELKVSVKNIGADSRFYYTPYELTKLRAEGESVLNDQILDDGSLYAEGIRGQREYDFESLSNQVKKYPELVASLAKNKSKGIYTEYLTDESHYNKFVYETYLQLPSNTQKVLQDHLGSYDKKNAAHLDYKSAKEKILDYLNKEIKYTEQIQKRSGNTDFLVDFLDISKSGYSVHYATAATLMFRYYGIPARYVEGYLITPAIAHKANDIGTAILTDNESHAWVEYYQDGIGWIPFETTPPYMDVMEQPESLSSSSSGGTQGESSGTGQALEMKQDNYEAEEPETDEEKPTVPWEKIGIAAVSLLFLIVILAVAVHLIKRKKKLNDLERSFEETDKNISTINVFAYIMELHKALDIKQDNCSIYDYMGQIAKCIGTSMAEEYEKVAAIYQKASYSNGEIEDNEFIRVREYKEELLKTIKKRCKISKRIYLRWIKCLY